MLEAYLGEAPFRAGIRRYMAAHKYSNTTAADLWDALGAASGKPIGQIAPGWTEQPGLPRRAGRAGTRRECDLDAAAVLHSTTATSRPATLADPDRLADRRAAALRAGASCCWAAQPVVFPCPPGQRRSQRRKHRLSTVSNTPRACSGPWPLVWKLLPPADRVGLLGDTWAWRKRAMSPISDYLDLLQAARADTDLAVEEQIGGSLDTLIRLERGQPGQPAFESWLSSVLNAQFAAVGWEARPGEDKQRCPAAQRFDRHAGAVKRPRLSSLEARPVRGLFAEPGFFEAQPARPCVRHCWALCRPSRLGPSAYSGPRGDGREEKERFYRALSGALDPALAQQTLDLALTNEIDPNQTPGLIGGVAYSGEQPDLAWQFVRQHQAAVLAKQAAYARAGFVPGLFGAFTDAARADELEAFARAHPADAAPTDTARTAARIRFLARLKQRALPSLDRWIARHTKTPSP